MTIDKAKTARAIALIKKGSANADYFFEQLKSPVWIEPLAEAKLFSKPQPAIRRGETISFPAWVPGQYLARMAAIPEAQESVLEILRKIPESDNPRVYEVIADAASALPGKMARRLVPLLVRGTELPFQLSLPTKVTSVIVRLAKEGFTEEAMLLSKTLLAIIPQPLIEKEEEGEAEGFRHINREPRARISDWEYGEILDAILESLVQSVGIQAFELLCDLLEQAVAAGRKEIGDGPEDYSYIWRGSIEHAGARRENLRDELVSAVRDSASQLIEATPESLPLLVDLLQARSTRIFHRIALFLLWRHGEQNITVVRNVLDSPQQWEDIGFHPEYDLLLARFFSRLELHAQQLFLDWIDEGPDVERYIAFRRKMDGRDPQPSDIKLRQDIWTRDRLGVIASSLQSPHKERFATLQASLGPPPEVGRSLYTVSVGMRGELSPLSEEETLSLDWPSLITKLREWSPPTPDFDGPSVEGLANSLRQRVAANPAEAIQHLHDVVGVRPNYLAAILEALRDTIKKKEPLDWDLLLAFLHRVVREAETAVDEMDRWRWVSKATASLINDSFEAGAASIPYQFRQEVWRLIAQLAQNPDPTPEHENQYGGSNMDPATLSLNTVRGETFHAVVRHSLWVRREIERLPDGASRISRGFDELPEVRALLDAHLDPVLEPSLAVRAVYGQWFPWLVLIDAEWAVSRRDRIFPKAPELSTLFWAAWGTYIVFDPPYTNVLPILRPLYARAIAAIEEGMTLRIGIGERPSQHLAEHLMAYYWRGELTLAGDDVVHAFFAAADPKLRGHALEWVGRTLGQIEEPLLPPTEQRLKALWESRASLTQTAADELQAFGWWFASNRFDPGWSLQMLEQVLSRGVMPQPDHMVTEQLAAISSNYTRQAVESLTWMIDLGSHDWSIHGWLDSARRILEVGLRSQDADVRAQVERAINKLGALGFRDFCALRESVLHAKS